ncbi:MAG: hypothetical protein WCV69_04925 [Patescibacteria group bacterium]|jgi:hypothetical protein
MTIWEKPNTQTKADKERADREAAVLKDLYKIFDAESTSDKRIDALLDKIKYILDHLENSAEILASINILGQENDREIFCQKALSIVMRLHEWKNKNLEKFDQIARVDFNQKYGFLELNQLLSYSLTEDSAEIHVPPNEATSQSEKIKLFHEGLRKLVSILREKPQIKEIRANSWIVTRYPYLMKKLHFTIVDEIDPEARTKYRSYDCPASLALISKEDLIKYYS